MSRKDVKRTNKNHFHVKKRLHPAFFPRFPGPPVPRPPERERGPTRSLRERGGMGEYPLLMLTLRKSSIALTS
jgi:hypothetical protein